MAAGLALAVANGVLGKLGEIAAEKLVNEASLLLNFRDDFRWLETKLTDISNYLQYADEQTSLNASAKRWVSEVSDIALDAEDVIDECAVKPLYRKPTQSCVYNCSELGFRYKMGKRIKALKGRLGSAMQKAGELNLVRQMLHSNDASTSTAEIRGRERGMTGWSAVDEDSGAVGLEQKVEDIERLLDDPAIGVVAVVGMGGLGKTFLVKNVYERVKGRYQHSAWISVSQSYSLGKLQSDLASNIGLQMPLNISDFRAAELIKGHLHGKTCLIVLDDVWNSSVDGDLISKLGLSTGRNNQCKIVVTTRSRYIAAKMNACEYEMQDLSEENSWKLFCLFAFPHCEGNKPPAHLVSLARQIVEKCRGLPLAVKTVAASMASYSDIGVWQSKLRQLMGAEDSIMKILKLSYHSLPPYLKASFAYFSFFPEDTRISFSSDIFFESIYQEYLKYLWIAEGLFPTSIYQEYLIYSWIAEGFIPQENDRDQFDIGLSYLQQLQNLCLLEVDGSLPIYTIHDLLLELVNDISKEHKSEFVLPVNKTSCRRLLLSKKGITSNAISNSSIHCQRFLRTISFAHNPEITSIPEHLFDSLKVLRVLDLSCTAIPTLPKSVGKLKLLKVLNLSETEIREVPDCVRRLKCLEYLDVSQCRSLQRVPDWIGELQSLSYLNVQSCSGELVSHFPKGIAKLSNLRVLRSNYIPLSSEDNEFLNVQDVGDLVNLREIRFSLKDEGALRIVEDGALERMVKMRILKVNNDIPARENDREESSLPAFPEKMNAMTDLSQLYIRRFSVPSWICGVVNLTKLVSVKCSGYPSLQNMPNLEFLTLFDDSRCTELPVNFGECGGFPKLVKLFIVTFPVLEELPKLEEGAMQRLETLWIVDCPRVKKASAGLERLRRLKWIVVQAASAELKERLNEGGEDWSKIKATNPNSKIDVVEGEIK